MKFRKTASKIILVVVVAAMALATAGLVAFRYAASRINSDWLRNNTE